MSKPTDLQGLVTMAEQLFGFSCIDLKSHTDARLGPYWIGRSDASSGRSGNRVIPTFGCTLVVGYYCAWLFDNRLRFSGHGTAPAPPPAPTTKHLALYPIGYSVN